MLPPIPSKGKYFNNKTPRHVTYKKCMQVTKRHITAQHVLHSISHSSYDNPSLTKKNTTYKSIATPNENKHQAPNLYDAYPE
mmetsp:Transcript_1267/g.2750  ORF Transcript_1267/g.2750 Transcript_1267/m.2750 type:complete len:82 (-) Transcript_1267:1872-2117(-)